MFKPFDLSDFYKMFDIEEEHMRAIFRYYVVNLCDNTIVKSGATVSSEEDVRLDVGRLLTEEEYTLVKAGDLKIVTEFVTDID